MELLIGLLIPFIGTTLGAFMVFFMKNKINVKLEKMLLGFASGVMIAASIWSLIIPSIEMAEESGAVPWLPASIGFMLGILFLLFLDTLIPHLHLKSDKPEGLKTNFKKTTMMILAVTLHNIPERNGSRCNICRCNKCKSSSYVIWCNGISNSELLFKTFQKVQLFQCHLKQKECLNLKLFLWELYLE